jgi:hypothetical protein
MAKKNKIVFKKPQKMTSIAQQMYHIGTPPTSIKIPIKKPANTVKNSACHTPLNKSPATGMSLRSSIDPTRFQNNKPNITLRIAQNNAFRQQPIESPHARIPDENELDDSQDMTPTLVTKKPGMSVSSIRKSSINNLPKMKIINLN